MKFDREQYLELMLFGNFDRQMFVELFGPLVGLEEQWRQQGASEDELNMIGFDWDYVPICDCGANTALRSDARVVVLEETDEYLIEKDEYGRTRKLCKAVATVPLPLDYPVKNMDDWLKMKSCFEFHEDRIDRAALEQAKEARERDELIVAYIPGGFDLPRQLMGEEGACLAYYEQPELMHDIIDTARRCSVDVLSRVTDELIIDQLSVHEDLAGKSGPLVGPKQVEEFIQPYFRAAWDVVESTGGKVFQMDSDGNVNPVIDAFLDCGLTCIYPMEPAAGMDVVALRAKYGKRLMMLGGIDKHVLRRSKEEIRAELEYKMQASMLQGGMVFGLDHRIPNGTPLENYRYYVDLGREILGLPPLEAGRKGWARMAS
jgi:uroporphyrinogen-III decarboxylase